MITKRSEAQNRSWLYKKLFNFKWKILNRNAYGVLMTQKTIVVKLREIIDEFEQNICEKK